MSHGYFYPASFTLQIANGMSDSNSLREIEIWLARASGTPPAEEIQTIRRHLAIVAKESPSSAIRQHLLEGLHMRTSGAIEALIPRLYSVRLPISNNTRQTVRSMQETLDSLARLGLDTVESPDAQLVKGLGTPIDLALWRIFEALTQNLTLANLIAAPPSPGTWLRLNRAYLAAWRHRAERKTPTDTPYDVQTLYARALICGSLAPSALNAHEWAFLHRFIAAAKCPLIVTNGIAPSNIESTLWVSSEMDAPPTLMNRRPPSEGALTFFVQCCGILSEIKQALSALVQGEASPDFLPSDTSARVARIALRRLRDHLSSPRSRRFPRRRQGYRATLCVGFDDICYLFKTGITTNDTISEWMVVNESPGGYATMHVAGRPRKAQVGDLVAMRREGETHWGISVVRWALSENPEHLEFGLEEISPTAISGYMTTPGQRDDRHPLALLLPAIPPLRELDALAFSPSARPARDQNHAFICDGEKAEVREFRLARPIEQSSGIDVCLIGTTDKAG